MNRLRKISTSASQTDKLSVSDFGSRQNTMMVKSTESTSKLTPAAQPQSQPPPPPRQALSQSSRGPTLLGLLAAKRLTRKLQLKYGRTHSQYGSSKYSNSVNAQREPTYRMEPRNKFDPSRVETIVKGLVDARMNGLRYHPKFCSNLCKILSDEIKEAVKKLRYDRYKIVAVVHIGQKNDQSTMVTSRCAWDPKLDQFASYNLETGSLFCNAIVYGIYTE